MTQIASFENFGHKHILTIAIPVILSNITTPLVGLADIATIGHATLPDGVNSAAATGAVAFGSMLFSLVFGSFIFFKMGTSGFVAQAKGAGNVPEIAALLLRSLLVAIIIGLLVILLRQPVIDLIFLVSNASADVQVLSSDYYNIRALAAPFTLMNFVILGWLMGQGRAKLGLVVQLILNFSNIALNLLFVLELNMAVEGVAWASFAAEIIAFIISIAIITRLYGSHYFSRPLADILNRSQLLRMFNVNRDILIRSIALTLTFTWFTMQSANMGDVTLASNAILLQIVAVFAYFLDGFATSAEVFIGQSIGAKNSKIFNRALNLSLIWAFAMGLILAALGWFFGSMIIDFMSQDLAIRSQAKAYLFWPLIIVMVGPWCYTMDGVFIGATRGADMRNMMLISFVTYLASWYILVFFWGNHGQWMAFLVMYFVRGFSLQTRMPNLRRHVFNT